MELTVAKQLQNLLSARDSRRADTLRIFRPQRHQLPIFHSTAREMFVGGGVRAGKTTCISALIGSAATGIPLLGPDGEELPFLFPRHRPLTIWLIGLGERHIGDTFHRMLFQRNPEMRMIRDLETKKWRIFNPNDPSDIERDHKDPPETRPAPPIIPSRYIESWGWANKSIRHFNICRLKPRAEFGKDWKHGTTIHAFTSSGEVKMGDPVDIIWIDEQFARPEHYTEWQSRVSDRKGRIIMSFWPGRYNPAVVALNNRANAAALEPPPRRVEKIELWYSQNPYIDDKEKVQQIKAWADQEGPEMAMSRDRGTLLTTDIKVYPSFSPYVHRTPALAQSADDPIDEAIRNNQFVPPYDWCLDLVLDPGHQHPGVLFCAIPPPELGSAGIIWDELYIQQIGASELAKKVYSKLIGRSVRRFIIDVKAGQQSTMGGGGVTIADVYAKAFEEVGLKSETTGHHFHWSSAQRLPDIAQVREKMLIDPVSGKPWLRVVSVVCRNLLNQLAMYHKAQTPDGFVKEEPAERQVDPLCDCLRYWVASQPKYVRPAPLAANPITAYDFYLLDEKERADRYPKDSRISLGPPQPGRLRVA